MPDIEILLKKAEEYIEKAIKAEELGKFRTARDHYLKAGRQLFNAAGESKGRDNTAF